VAEKIETASSVPVQIDAKSLANIGVLPDAPLTFQVKDLSLRSILNRLLQNLDLTWLPQDDSLLVTTRETADSRLTLQSYPIADLAGPISATAGSPNRVVYTDLDYLANILQQTVAPASWKAVGGRGTVNTASGDGRPLLAVRQTYEVHRRIAKLLDDLRRASARNLGKRQ